MISHTTLSTCCVFPFNTSSPHNMGSTALDILPPAKRMREEKAEPVLFFDAFCEEILENVLRYFSRLPNAKKWASHIDVRNLVKAFGVRGGFGTLLKSHFRTLRVSRKKNCDGREVGLGWKELTEPYLWTSEIAVAHTFVMAGGGESLRKLVISRDMYKRGRDGTNIVDDFVKHCPNITSLTIAEKCGTIWANKFGSQLEILEIDADGPIDISEDAPALRELNMAAYKGNSDLLRRIGGKLERLVINDASWQGDNNVGLIEQHCPNLKSISLYGRDEGDISAITQLLGSYGERLDYALLYYFDNAQIIDVAAKCPNARFDVCSGDYTFGLSLSSFNLIVPRLESVVAEDTEPQPEEIAHGLVEWTNAWNQCVNLRHLKYEPRKIGEVGAIFSTPKNHLASIELDLDSVKPEEDAKKAMVNLANGTTCVEKLCFDGPPCSIDEFGAFIRKNRATLRCIELDSSSGTFSTENEKVDELLKSFLHLPVLEELYVDYKIPQDILTSLHNKGVYYCRDITHRG